uniref:Ig-like domain-containing protein n=1 Tax=Salmo trutta TaxID=8032 RepID=A0A673XGP5_SALTR
YGTDHDTPQDVKDLITSTLFEENFDASSWTAEVPNSVSGLRGSPIVIPCSFNYLEPEKKPSEFTGIWFKDNNEVIYHPDSSNIIQDYKGRTELVGDLRLKNCSLRIDPLHCSDKGPFTFRIEIKGHDKYLYKDNTVSIAVSSKGGLSAFCSVSHFCLSDYPLLTWSHSGIPSVQSQQLTNGQWKVTSSLTFNPSSTDHNQSLVCTAPIQLPLPLLYLFIYVAPLNPIISISTLHFLPLQIYHSSVLLAILYLLCHHGLFCLYLPYLTSFAHIVYRLIFLLYY